MARGLLGVLACALGTILLMPAPSEAKTDYRVRPAGTELFIDLGERGDYEVVLEANEERTWEGEQSIYFICGNAGGVEVTVNGEALGTLGGRAEVVDRTWTPLGEATPTGYIRQAHGRSS